MSEELENKEQSVYEKTSMTYSSIEQNKHNEKVKLITGYSFEKNTEFLSEIKTTRIGKEKIASITYNFEPKLRVSVSYNGAVQDTGKEQEKEDDEVANLAGDNGFYINVSMVPEFKRVVTKIQKSRIEQAIKREVGKSLSKALSKLGSKPIILKVRG